MTRLRLVALAAFVVAVAACGPAGPPPRTPEQVRDRLLDLLPDNITDRRGWAQDIEAAFTALRIEPSDANLCATLAVTEQESTFTADPPVPGLGKIASEEIVRRAQSKHVPAFAVRVALQLESPDGHTYEERLAHVRTERELSELYEEIIAKVPLGPALLASSNPVHTGGPMQVSVAFALAHARLRDYPYPDVVSIRHEVFTRRGGLYFGIAHLLGYEASYPQPLFRFADFNAGPYASRNAAFQQAVARLTETPLALDGDLVAHGHLHGKRIVGATEMAVRALSPRLGMDADAIRRDLDKGDRHAFERTSLFERVFALADADAGLSVPRAVLPRIDLKSPKITRKLTTEWFARRVQARYERCLARAG